MPVLPNDDLTDAQLDAAVELAGSLIVPGGHPVLDEVYRNTKDLAATVRRLRVSSAWLQTPSCCSRCVDDHVAGLPDDAPFSARICRTMMLCDECGNKRCPKASDHRHDCTGSNEPGQPGSRY